MTEKRLKKKRRMRGTKGDDEDGDQYVVQIGGASDEDKPEQIQSDD